MPTFDKAQITLYRRDPVGRSSNAGAPLPQWTYDIVAFAPDLTSIVPQEGDLVSLPGAASVMRVVERRVTWPFPESENGRNGILSVQLMCEPASDLFRDEAPLTETESAGQEAV